MTVVPYDRGRDEEVPATVPLAPAPSPNWADKSNLNQVMAEYQAAVIRLRELEDETAQTLGTLEELGGVLLERHGVNVSLAYGPLMEAAAKRFGS